MAERVIFVHPMKIITLVTGLLLTNICLAATAETFYRLDDTTIAGITADFTAVECEEEKSEYNTTYTSHYVVSVEVASYPKNIIAKFPFVFRDHSTTCAAVKKRVRDSAQPLFRRISQLQRGDIHSVTSEGTSRICSKNALDITVDSEGLVISQEEVSLSAACPN
ncbi:MAG: hypothetical protein KA715_04100 [Xanthomonadaceae bacterium]|nr:hypothetical protein [Xanthomonadaceae bacterium]